MRKQIVLVSLLLVSSVWLLVWFKVPHRIIGFYLAPSSSLSAADAIVVVSGSDERIDHAIRLYRSGYAPRLILSGAAREGDTSNARAMSLEATMAGVPEQAIYLEEKATNTYENALYTKEYIKSKNLKKLILVTSLFHQRRAYETFRYVYGDSSMTFINSPAKSSYWNNEHWWDNPHERDITKSEIIKIVGAKLFGRYHR